MARAKKDSKDLRSLSRLFAVEASFLEAARREDEEGLDVRRVRRLQRVCAALDVEPDIAAMLVDLTDRVAELEALLRSLG